MFFFVLKFFCIYQVILIIAMSWLNNFTDLAGKAESLLNNIDQTAAVAISKASTPSKSESSASPPEHEENKSVLKQEVNVSTEDVSHTSVTSSPLSTKPQLQRRENERLRNKKQTDDALFDFLNSSQKVVKSHSTASVASKPAIFVKEDLHKSSKKKMHSSSAGVIKDQVSRNSSYDSLVSKKSERKPSNNGSVASDHPESNSDPGMRR